MKDKQTELLMNPDGSIYHLKLKPEDIARKIILVGDPERVEMVSSYFDKVEIRKENREFITHTGSYNGTRISVMSTGIGTDNIDIVMNEIDALANIDLQNKVIKPDHTSLQLVRIGTTGGLHQDIPLNSYILSRYACGFDNVLNFYSGRDLVCDQDMEREFVRHTGWSSILHAPYFVRSSDELFNLFPAGMVSGITISAPGFFGPQGRVLRLETMDPDLNNKLQTFRYGDLRITNFEMESSALFGLSKLLGHHAISICLMAANRATGKATDDYYSHMKELIKFTLDIFCSAD
ncbi:MAG: nucleoside phosphorylase [Bacteroidales bacterium]|nr:nucleoside phosphorylase [Bacteroidales bacterium]